MLDQSQIVNSECRPLCHWEIYPNHQNLHFQVRTAFEVLFYQQQNNTDSKTDTCPNIQNFQFSFNSFSQTNESWPFEPFQQIFLFPRFKYLCGFVYLNFLHFSLCLSNLIGLKLDFIEIACKDFCWFHFNKLLLRKILKIMLSF